MKLTLTNSKTVGDRTLEVYKIADYEVRVVIHKEGYVNVSINNHGGEFTPGIYCDTDIDGKITGFSVQTTSYGALPAKEIALVAEELKKAAEIALFLTETFASCN